MEVGWKDRKVMNSTHFIRNIVSQVERSLGQDLDLGESFRFENEVMIAVAVKFNSTPTYDITESLNGFKLKIPVVNLKDFGTISYVLFK